MRSAIAFPQSPLEFLCGPRDWERFPDCLAGEAWRSDWPEERCCVRLSPPPRFWLGDLRWSRSSADAVAQTPTTNSAQHNRDAYFFVFMFFIISFLPVSPVKQQTVSPSLVLHQGRFFAIPDPIAGS
jgi:hypothetical protein